MSNKELNVRKHIPYEIDFEYLNTKVEFFLEIPNENQKKVSFWEIIEFFSDKPYSEEVDSSFGSCIYVECSDIEYKILCKNLIARQVLSIMLNLQNEKKSLYSNWYLYDYDSCNEMPQFIHSFFLADSGKIQLERASISTSWMDECDQNIFVEETLVTVPDSSMPLWDNMEEDQRAVAHWYYQKFYQETERGQILSIRENLSSVKSTDPVIPSTSMDQALLSSINRKLKFAVIVLIGILFKMLF